MDAFCKFCGAQHSAADYPKQCLNCEQITWANPIPVAVLIQPVRNPAGPVGLLIGQRGIAPFEGEWGLPAGYVDMDDDNVESAAIRELREETNMVTAIEHVRPVWTYSNHRTLMIFCLASRPLLLGDLEGFAVNKECTAIDVIYGPRDLCFPSHTQAVAQWFEGKFR